MIDFLGQEVKVGDYVTFNHSGKGLTLGLVEKITPAQVKIVYAMAWSKMAIDFVRKAHDCVVKVTVDNPQVQAHKKKVQAGIMLKVVKELS